MCILNLGEMLFSCKYEISASFAGFRNLTLILWVRFGCGGGSQLFLRTASSPRPHTTARHDWLALLVLRINLIKDLYNIDKKCHMMSDPAWQYERGWLDHNLDQDSKFRCTLIVFFWPVYFLSFVLYHQPNFLATMRKDFPLLRPGIQSHLGAMKCGMGWWLVIHFTKDDSLVAGRRANNAKGTMEPGVDCFTNSIGLVWFWYF